MEKSLDEKMKECMNNGKHLAKKTNEGYICTMKGLNNCPNQGKMSENYTNYFYCTHK